MTEELKEYIKAFEYEHEGVTHKGADAVVVMRRNIEADGKDWRLEMLMPAITSSCLLFLTFTRMGQHKKAKEQAEFVKNLCAGL